MATKAKKEGEEGTDAEGGEKKKAPRKTRTGLTREQKKELDKQVADQAKAVKKKIIIFNVLLLVQSLSGY